MYGISNNYNNKKIYFQSQVNAGSVEHLEQAEELGVVSSVDENENLEIIIDENETTSAETNKKTSKNEQDELNKLLISQMKAEIERLQSEYEGATKNRGFFGVIGDGISGLWGGGSTKIKNQIKEFRKILSEAIENPAKLKEAYEKIMGAELTQEKMSEIAQANAYANTLTKKEKQEICNKLREQANNLSKELQEVKDGQGWFTKAIGGLNNILGFGTTGIKAKAKIEEFQNLVNNLDPNDPNFAAKYQAITGEALTEHSVQGLLFDTEAYIEECKAEYEKSTGKKLSDKEMEAFEAQMLAQLSEAGINTNKVSKAQEAIYDFENTSSMASDIAAGIVVAVVATVAVVAAPFTGGASIALAAGVGAVTNLAIKASDGLTSDAGYSFEQGVLDFASGAIDGAMAGVMAGSIAGKGLSTVFGAGAKGAGQSAVKASGKELFKNAGKNFAKSALRANISAVGSTTSHYVLDTVGKTALYDATGNYIKSEKPTNIGQNEDGTYTLSYEVKDATTGEFLYSVVEIVDSLSQDENGNLVKGSVIDTYQTNDFSFKELGKQALISSVSATAGSAIGTFTGGVVNPFASQATSSTAIGNVVEIATDASLSLGADYLIASAQRGEWMSAEEFFSGDRIFNEGLNQIRGLIIGNLGAKAQFAQGAVVSGAGSDKTYYEVKEYNPETETITVKDPTDPTKTYTVTRDEAIKMGAEFDIKTEDNGEPSNVPNNGNDTQIESTPNPEAPAKDSGNTDSKDRTIDESTQHNVDGSSSTAPFDTSGLTIEDKVKLLQSKNMFMYFEPATLKSIAELEGAQYQKALRLTELGVHGSYIKELAQLDDVQYKRALKMTELGIQGSYIKELAQLGDAQYQRALGLLDKQVCADDIKNLASLDDVQYKRALELLDKGIPSADLYLIARIDNKTQYKKAVELLNSGIGAKDAYAIVKLDNANYKKVKTLISKGIPSSDALFMVHFKGKEYDRLVELYNMELSISDACNIISTGDIQYKRAIELLNKGVDAQYVYEFATMEDSSYKVITELLDTGIKGARVKSMLNSVSNTKFARINEITDKGIDATSALFLTLKYNASDTQIDKIVSLLEQGASINTAIKKVFCESDVDLRVETLEVFTSSKVKDVPPLDINDPKYNNPTEIAQYLSQKIESQMGVLTSSDVEDIAVRLSTETGMSKDEIYSIMNRLTQFSSYSKLNDLGVELSKIGVGSFYSESGISANTALNYVQRAKHQFALTGNSARQAFVLDEAGVKYIESLEGSVRDEFIEKVNNFEIVLVNLDGINLKAGNNYYSATIFDGNQNLEVITREAIRQIQSGKSENEVLNSDLALRATNALGINQSIVRDVRISSFGPDAETITSQLKPNYPTAKEIEIIIDEYTKNILGANASSEDVASAKKVLAKYLDNMLDINSNEKFATTLRDKYADIQAQVEKLGKTMDDVYYLYPFKDRSFVLVDYMFAKANGIDTTRFIYDRGSTTFPKDAVIVLLDDVVGSGQTMDSAYNTSLISSSNNVILAPITCSSIGIDNLTQVISKRGKSDSLLVDNSNVKNYKEFEQLLTSEEKRLLSKMLGKSGFGSTNMCTSFPYMAPDNNSTFSGLFTSFMLNNRSASKSFDRNDNLYLKILDIIKARE